MGNKTTEWCDRCLAEDVPIRRWSWWPDTPHAPHDNAVAADLCQSCEDYVSEWVKRELTREGHF